MTKMTIWLIFEVHLEARRPSTGATIPQGDFSRGSITGLKVFPPRLTKLQNVWERHAEVRLQHPVVGQLPSLDAGWLTKIFGK